MKLLRKRKRDYFRNLDPRGITDNRKFLKSVKPIFSDKVQTYQSITRIENGELANDDLTIAEIFNHYFANITQELGITGNEAHLSTTIRISDPIDLAIKNYQKHPSISKIK